MAEPVYKAWEKKIGIDYLQKVRSTLGSKLLPQTQTRTNGLAFFFIDRLTTLALLSKIRKHTS